MPGSTDSIAGVATARDGPSMTAAASPTIDYADLAAAVLQRLRERRPRVHCITNAVAQGFTPNLLLAAGAVPSMTIAPEEIGEFVRHADALLVNLGTLDPARRQAINIAVEHASDAAIPWVLDPVFVDRSRARTDYARALMSRKPGGVRLNRSEFRALAGFDAEGGALAGYAADNLTVVGLTGQIDLVTDGGRLLAIQNGAELMSRVTAMGCAGTALVAACMAVESDPFNAMVAGLLILGVAGECAAARAAGPGSFAVEILDQIYHLDRTALVERANVT